MSATVMIDTFRRGAVPALMADSRIIGVLEAGAGAAGLLDRFSDLDLVLVAADDAYEALLAERVLVAKGLGELLSCFTGEHVGEPRLLICLYGCDQGDGVLHVDLKVVRASDLAARVDDPRVLADPTGAAAATLAATPAIWPDADPQWFEERIWIWLHYAAARLGRGEVFEALDGLGFLRSRILGPMLARRGGRPQRGLRRLESVPGAGTALQPTLAGYDRADILRGLEAVAALYIDLRRDAPPPDPRAAAEASVLGYIAALSRS